jgi:hypothetical protein
MRKITISPKSGLILFVIALLAGPYVWRFTAEPIVARQAAWEGKIVRKREKRRGNYSSHWAYLWYVDCSDGKTRKVRVTRNLYIASRPNHEVRKLKGERWPRLKDYEGRGHPAIRDQLPKDLFPDKE